MKLSSNEHNAFYLFSISDFLFCFCFYFFYKVIYMSVHLGGRELWLSLNSYPLKIFVLFICLQISSTHSHKLTRSVASCLPIFLFQSPSCKCQILQAFLPHYVYNKLHISLSDPDYKCILFTINLSPCMLITYNVHGIIRFLL